MKCITIKKNENIIPNNVTFIVALKGRTSNIAGFTQNITKYYPNANIIFSVQTDDKDFNKGALYNLAYKQTTSDIVVFHDIDIRHTKTINFSEELTKQNAPFVSFNIIKNYKDNKLIGSSSRPTAFGGCVAFTRKQFEDCLGYSNLITHWGYEDALLYKRANLKRLNNELIHIFHKREVDNSINSGNLEKNKAVYNNDNPNTDNYLTANGKLILTHKESNIIWLEYQDLKNNTLSIFNGIDNVNNHVKLKKSRNIYNNIKNKIGVIYTTFYDLDMIEDSLLSIRGIASYIILVHQKVGFNGKKEPEMNNDIIKHLIDDNLIDDIIYYEGNDITTGMIDKFNKGLDKIKQQNCDYVISLAPDMRYNSSELKEEINIMQLNNIDTLYMGLKAYYYDEYHYFIDTYYTPSVYKVDERIFERTQSSVLCDPSAKMKEKKYKISKYFCHHYTFLKQNYSSKLDNSIRCTSVHRHKLEMKQIYEKLQNWKEGDAALVFTNDMNLKGKVVLKEKELQKKSLNKICILIPFYKRDIITNFVFDYYSKIKESLKSDMELILICVGSEGNKSKLIAENNNFNYIEYPNNSIQLKHDALYLEAKKYNPDACIKVDSDSIISKEFFYYWNNLINYGYDYSEVLDIYFQFNNNVSYWSGYKDKRQGEGTGVGRFMSRRLLDMIDWKIIGENKNTVIVDYYMTKKINKLEILKDKITCKNLNGYIVELKSETQLTNINSFNYDYIYPVSHLNININNKINNILVENNNINNFYSVIIPTMWRSNYIFDMLKIYDNNPIIKEVIVIDNDPSFNYNLKEYKKCKKFSKGNNIYVNPAWNWGVDLSSSKYIIIANDDIFIKENDLNSLLNDSINYLELNCLIGASEHCFKEKGLILNKLNFIKANERNWSFGTFMMLKKENYTIIPNDILIWCGDDIQFANNNSYKFSGIEIKTKPSTTINNLGVRNIAKEDIIRASKYKYNDLKTNNNNKIKYNTK